MDDRLHTCVWDESRPCKVCQDDDLYMACVGVVMLLVFGGLLAYALLRGGT